MIFPPPDPSRADKILSTIEQYFALPAPQPSDDATAATSQDRLIPGFILIIKHSPAPLYPMFDVARNVTHSVFVYQKYDCHPQRS